MIKKDILSRSKIARESGDLQLAGMLEDYARLKYSFIPQLLVHFEPAPGGRYFPHMSKIKNSRPSLDELMKILNETD